VGEPLNHRGRGCGHAGKYKLTPWKIPQYVVPDLTGCEVRALTATHSFRSVSAVALPRSVSCIKAVVQAAMPVEASCQPPSTSDDIDHRISRKGNVTQATVDATNESPAPSFTHSASASASVWLPQLKIGGVGGVAAQAVRVAAAAGCRRRRRQRRHPQVTTPHPLSVSSPLAA
jgi:hypothetical protein